METRASGGDDYHPTPDGRRRGGGVDASGDVDVGRRCVDGNLVQAVAGSVVVDATDDEIDIVEFRMGAGGAERWECLDVYTRVDLAHTPAGDEVFRGSYVAWPAVTSRLRLVTSAWSSSSTSTSLTPR